MAARKPADHAVRRTLVEDRTRSFLVEAGAGTGKTHVMVNRIADTIRSGEANIREIVAITFTEKAAAELKARLRGTLTALLARARAEEDSERVARFREALADLETAAIGTIHSFASGLIKERPVEVGVDPGFVILEEGAAAEEEIRDIWKQWRESHLAENPDFWRRVLHLFRLNDEEDGMWELARSLAEHPDLLEEPADAHPIETAAAGDTLNTLIGLAEDLAGAIDRGCADPADAMALLRDLKDRFRAMQDLDRHGLLRELLRMQSPSRATKGNKKNWRDNADLEAAREAVCSLRDVLENFKQEFYRATLAESLRAAREFVRLLQARKKSRGILAFQDLLLLARDLLRDNRHVRERYQNRYKFILVDEFQDTDPLQMEIVLYLAGDGAGIGDWLETGPAKGKLFLVGDPKQSIYRFRRADIELYSRIKGLLREDAGSTVEGIRVNFRSTSSVIGWVNERFGALMADGGDEAIQPPYAELEAHRDDAPEGPGVALLLPPEAGDLSKVDALREAEAQTVAALIRRIVDQESWKVRSPETGEVRPARFGDIGVLYPKRTGLPAYEDALRQNRIPFVSDSGKEFYQLSEVRYLLACLRAVENPHDAISVTAALTSIFFGFKDEDVLVHLAAGGSLDCTAAAPEENPGLAAALSFLRDLHRDRNRVPAFRIIDRILWGTAASPFFMLRPQGRRIDSSLSMLRDRARILQANDALSFGRTVAALETERIFDKEVAEFTSPEAGRDQVQLLTFHKAKGLEFPVVILVNLASGTSGPQNKSIQILPDRIHRRVEVRVSVPDQKKVQAATPDYERAAELERQKEEAENIRKLYVAATRARDHLVVSRFGQDRRGSYIDLLGELEPGDGVFAIRAEDFDIAPAQERSFLVPSDAPVDRSDDGLADRVKQMSADLATLLERTKAAVPVINPSRLEKRGLFAVDGETDIEAAGAVVGDAFHEAMETFDPLDPASIDAAVRAACGARGISEHAQVIASWAGRVLDSDLGQRILKAGPGNLFREAPFAVWHEASLLEGAIDLLFREGDKLILVDYKTDRVLKKRAAERAEWYRPQLEAYAKAVEIATGRSPDEVYVVFAREAVAVPLADLGSGAK